LPADRTTEESGIECKVEEVQGQAEGEKKKKKSGKERHVIHCRKRGEKGMETRQILSRTRNVRGARKPRGVAGEGDYAEDLCKRQTRETQKKKEKSARQKGV